MAPNFFRTSMYQELYIDYKKYLNVSSIKMHKCKLIVFEKYPLAKKLQ